MGKALYRKYRSRSLDEIVGQDHVVSILKRALNKKSIGHAYLLTGIRGTGKTSIARILAAEINSIPYDKSSNSLDIIEIDAASNNSVEDIRDLREKARIAPTSSAKKIYIIDEVHMLSKSAFNALLKTLEEPPEHVVFILATTNVEKLPATILSRVQRYNLHPISDKQIQKHLAYIAKSEKINISEEALEIIARHGNGSFRDSISILDQVSNSSDETITKEHVESLLGLIPSEQIDTLIGLYKKGEPGQIITYVQSLENTGCSASTLMTQLILIGKSRLVSEPELLPLLDKLVEASRSQWPDVKLLAALCSSSRINSPDSGNVAPTKTPAPSKPTSKATVVSRPKTPTVTKEVEKVIPVITPTVSSVEFPWQQFIETVKMASMGAYSVLHKSGYDCDGQTLFIHTGKEFSKKQLEKSLPMLTSTATSVGGAEIAVELLASKKAPEDSQVAAVVAMMGGGEEVDIDG